MTRTSYTESLASPEGTPQAAGRLADILFWCVAVFLLFWELGSRGLWTAEGRWAEVAREMLLTGDFFHPTLNGMPYFDKPLFSYWLIALVAPLTGLNEWALRIPSAVCGLAALWATRWLGKRLFSETTGRLAGWILLTSQGFLFWARTGQADMANVAFILLAVVWYWRRRDMPCFLTYLVFYLILFVGAQMKGLTAVIVPALVIFPDLLREKRWKSLLSGPHFLALIAGAMVYLVPFLYSSMTRGDYGSSGLALVFQENVQRFFNPFDHEEPFYAYFKHVPVLFLPWAPVLILALLAAAFSADWRRLTRSNLWLGSSIVLIFLFFSASGSRRSYYILPILPFCALFSARLLLTVTRPAWQRVAQSFLSIVWLLATALGLAAALAIPLIAPRLGLPVPGGLGWAGLALAALSALGWAGLLLKGDTVERRWGMPRRLVPIVISSAVFVGGYHTVIQPMLTPYSTEKGFCLAVRQSGRIADRVAFFDHKLENVVFYLDMSPPFHPVIPDSAQAYAWLSSDPSRVILLRRRLLPELLQDFPPERQGREAMGETVFSWDKEKKIRNKVVAWTLEAKPADGPSKP